MLSFLNMKPRNDAYLAGIIDGEGTIRPYRGRGNGRSLSVVNTDRELIDWIVAHYPGCAVYERSRPESHYKQQWYLTWTAKATILAVLDAIEPYLIVKADLAAEMRRDITNAPGMGSPGIRRVFECKKGHDLSTLPSGVECPQCRREYAREYQRRRRAERAAAK